MPNTANPRATAASAPQPAQPIDTVRLRGMENSVYLTNRRGEVVAEVFTDVEPGDQYERAAAMAAAQELRAALEELRNATLPGAPVDLLWLGRAHARANDVLHTSRIEAVLERKDPHERPRP